MTEPDLSEEFLQRLRAVKGKRARTVVEHILRQGFVTTEELEQQYGYKHPPRAAHDVREQGIPLETFSVKSADGRTIAAYRFADPSEVRHGRIGGRMAFPRDFKDKLYAESGGQCAICLGAYEARYLQIDHRIPYEVAGEPADEARDSRDFMLLCGSCNRAKSWSCEHCANWLEDKDPDVCATCYWADPETYRHVALRPVRRLDLVWTEEEVALYERLRLRAEQRHETMPDYVKAVLEKHLLGNDQ